jgi:hypothetical protein
MTPRVRDYAEIQQRVDRLARRGYAVTRAASIWGYPFHVVRRTTRDAVATVMLSAGLHGEEPAGVEAALQWLESGQADRWPVNWFVLPCINPYGWERNQRVNKQRRDINRQFRGIADCPEANLVKRLLARQRFLLSMEFHEDSDGHGYYLYEVCERQPFVGEAVVDAVRRVIPLHRGRVYDGNRAIAPGLIRRDPTPAFMNRRRRWPMALYVFRRHTAHCLGSETPVHRPMAQRVRAHMVTLHTALGCLLEHRDAG